jgi:hypothetical protein
MRDNPAKVKGRIAGPISPLFRDSRRDSIFIRRLHFDVLSSIWHIGCMAEKATLIEAERLVVHTGPVIEMGDETFFQFCQLNRDLQIERDADGDILITAPEGGSSGSGSGKLTTVFGLWAEPDGTGRIFGCSSGFKLQTAPHAHPMWRGSAVNASSPNR